MPGTGRPPRISAHSQHQEEILKSPRLWTTTVCHRSMRRYAGFPCCTAVFAFTDPWTLLQYEPDHITITHYIEPEFLDMLFAHTRGLKLGSKLAQSTKPRARSRGRSNTSVEARSYSASRVSSPCSCRSRSASMNRAPSSSARKLGRDQKSTAGEHVSCYISPYVESSEEETSIGRCR